MGGGGSLMCCTFGWAAPLCLLFCCSFPSWGNSNLWLFVHYPRPTAQAAPHTHANVPRRRVLPPQLSHRFLFARIIYYRRLVICQRRHPAALERVCLAYMTKKAGDHAAMRKSCFQNLAWWRRRRLCLHRGNCHVSIWGATPVHVWIRASMWQCLSN